MTDKAGRLDALVACASLEEALASARAILDDAEAGDEPGEEAETRARALLWLLGAERADDRAQRLADFETLDALDDEGALGSPASAFSTRSVLAALYELRAYGLALGRPLGSLGVADVLAIAGYADEADDDETRRAVALARRSPIREETGS